MRTRLTIAAAGVFLVGAAGCQSYNERRGKGDAPVGATDDTPAKVVNFPNGFMNVAFKCIGPNGVYAHTREAAPAVVPDDPNCATGAAGDG